MSTIRQVRLAVRADHMRAGDQIIGRDGQAVATVSAVEVRQEGTVRVDLPGDGHLPAASILFAADAEVNVERMEVM